MLIKIGPVSFESAQAWLDYARESLAALTSEPTPVLSASILESFEGYVEEWGAVPQVDGMFEWSDERDVEEVEFMTKALYETGLAIEAGHEVGDLRLRPAAADRFHFVLVQSVVNALEQEGGGYAQFAESIRDEWGPASNN